MPDYGSIINAIIPVAGGVLGSIGANKAQGKGIELSQEALDRAKAEAAAAYGQAATGAAGALQQGQQGAQSALDYGYTNAAGQLASGFDQANQFLPWGYQQGNAARSTGLQNSLGALATGYGNANNILSPYSNSGVQALNQSNYLLSGKGTPGGGGMPQINAMPATQYAQQYPIPQMNSLSGQGVKPLNLPKMNLNSLSGGLGGVGALGGSATGSLAGIPDPSGTNLATTALNNSNVRGAEGALGGIAVGAGISGLGLALGSIPLLAAIPFVGPILAGVGALIGKLWNNHNPDKTWASNAINEVSKQTWGAGLDGTGGIIGAVRSGQITAEQGNTAFQALWQGWIQSMQKAGVDQSIINRSIEDQTRWFSNVPQGLKDAEAYAKKQSPPPAPTSGASNPNGPLLNTKGYAQGGMIPGKDMGHDTVPAMLRGGEFVMTPEAVRHFGVAKLHKMNQAGMMNSLSNPQHFATGGTVQPYDPKNPNATQDWTSSFANSASLPAGYSTYVQGYNPITQSWEYNPNTGEKYAAGADKSLSSNFYSGGAPGSQTPYGGNTLAAGMPQAGDPNYYKYTSVGGQPYSMPAPTTSTTASNASKAGTTGAVPNATGGNFANDTQNLWDQGPKTQIDSGAQDFLDTSNGGVGATGAYTGPPVQPTGAQITQQRLANGWKPDPNGGWLDETGRHVPGANNTETGWGLEPGNGYTSPGGPGSVGPNQEQFPSNWNANGAPMPGVLNMTGANGATYETSPLYQWQLQQGEKNINRALQARGRANSSYGLNTLANFYNSLGANEAQQNYNRTFQMAQLGQQASLQQAALQAQYGNQASSVYQAAAQGDANAAQQLAQQMGVNATQYGQLLSILTQKYGGDSAQAQQALGIALANVMQWNAQGQAQNTWNWANPYSTNSQFAGISNANLATSLGSLSMGDPVQQLMKALGLSGGGGMIPYGASGSSDYGF